MNRPENELIAYIHKKKVVDYQSHACQCLTLVVNAFISFYFHQQAPGPDSISPMMLELFSINVQSNVYIILNTSMELSTVPNDWKKARISPIYKGESITDANNYCPVSLTCLLLKTIEHIICSLMWDHMDKNDIFTRNQHGFRKGLNTTTHLLHVTHSATEALDQKLDYYVVSFDLS